MNKSVAISILVLSTAPALATAETLLTCTAKGRVAGAPRYVVSRDRDGYNLVRQPINPTARSQLLGKFSSSNVVRYGSTIILTRNMGRSGFLHFYHRAPSGGASAAFMLDDSRFLQGNASGPITNYTCRVARF